MLTVANWKLTSSVDNTIFALNIVHVLNISDKEPYLRKKMS